MIPLTDRQMRLYRCLWEKTQGGTGTCTTLGLYVPGVPAATRKHALISLKISGVVSMEKEGKYRRITVLVSPDRVKLGTSSELAARHSMRNGREPARLLDAGAFISALRQAKVPLPLNVNTRCFGKFRAFRADARAL